MATASSSTLCWRRYSAGLHLFDDFKSICSGVISHRSSTINKSIDESISFSNFYCMRCRDFLWSFIVHGSTMATRHPRTSRNSALLVGSLPFTWGWRPRFEEAIWTPLTFRQVNQRRGLRLCSRRFTHLPNACKVWN